MGKVLYRKYRPQSFSEIVGQEHIVTTLQNAIKMDNVAHAYLFSGPRGTGKTTMARLFMKALNCIELSSETLAKTKSESMTTQTPSTDNQAIDICAKCKSCKSVEAGTHIDLIEIDAASNRGIDEMRQLKEAIRFSPVQGNYKVYIIDEVHMLTKEAFNALLKTLEEPPKHVVFILATTEPHKVLPTIISRTQRFDFRFLTVKEIKDRVYDLLKKEDKKLAQKSVQLIVSAAGGSLRDAESILGKILSLGEPTPEQVRSLLGIVDFNKIAIFIDYIAGLKKEEALNYITTLTQEGSDLSEFTNGIINHARTLLLLKLSPSSQSILTENMTKEEAELTKAQAASLTEKNIYSIIKEFLEVSNSIKHSPLPQLPLELAVVHLTNKSIEGK